MFAIAVGPGRPSSPPYLAARRWGLNDYQLLGKGRFLCQCIVFRAFTLAVDCQCGHQHYGRRTLWDRGRRIHGRSRLLAPILGITSLLHTRCRVRGKEERGHLFSNQLSPESPTRRPLLAATWISWPFIFPATRVSSPSLPNADCGFVGSGIDPSRTCFRGARDGHCRTV